MNCRILFLFVIFLSLGGCETVDSAVGDFTGGISRTVSKGDASVEINPETGLVQPTSEATQQQEKEVSLSIGQPLSLDINNTETCNKQVRERFLGRKFNEIPKSALPAAYRITNSEAQTNVSPSLGRVSFSVDENNKIIQAYCG